MIRSLLFASTALASVAYFAKADAAASAPTPAPVPSPVPAPALTDTAAAPTPAPTPAPVKAKRQPGEMTSIVADFAIPAKKASGGRGGKTLYDFDKLEIGQSFAVKNKTVKGLGSTVNGANERFAEKVKDAEGNVIRVPDPKDASKQIDFVRQTRLFICREVDPTDPRNDGATVRVWRVPLDFKG